MTQPDTHELNQVMAEVAGKEIKKHVEGNPNGPEIRSGWVDLRRRSQYGEHWDWWSPCTDHNQMALVKVKLREIGCCYKVKWCNNLMAIGYREIHMAEVVCPPGRVFMTQHESELIALALAVKAWWKARVK